jgi:hypothetical protein
MTPLARFMRKVHVDALGCCVWTGARNRKGYGHFYFEGRTVQAHRWNYQRVFGRIPRDRQLDHLCRNRACVNPHHMEPVSPRENTLRSTGPTARNARKTTCPQGHAYDRRNTLRYRGFRYCRACRRERSRAA